MKLFFGEFKANYSKYYFPYQVWLLYEEGDNLEKIYDNGFLPMRNLPNVYYLCRNVRVNLSDFELSSENRRILRKMENFSWDLMSLSEFKYTSSVQKFCKDYAEQKFGKGVFPAAAAVKNVFCGSVYSHIMIFKQKTTHREAGYAILKITENLLQYAHSFYDLNFLKDNLGAGMMLSAINWAKEAGKKYAYLGSCYDKNALYKTEFKGVEFFNGFGWSKDLEELKILVEGYENEEVFLLKNKKHIEKFYTNLSTLLNNKGIRVNF